VEEDGALSLATDENCNIQPTTSLQMDNYTPPEVEEYGNTDAKGSTIEEGEGVVPLTTSESHMLTVEDPVKANESIVLMNGNADIPSGT
jgi:hypothetical protein